MKRLFGLMLLTFTLNALAIEIPTYENYEKVIYPDTKIYVEALDHGILKKFISCELNGKTMKSNQIKDFEGVIRDRFNLLIDDRSDLSNLYISEGNSPAFLISSKYNSNVDKRKMFDELEFYLTEDSKSVERIEYQNYEVKKEKINEGTIREPRMVVKDTLELKIDIRCNLQNS